MLLSGELCCARLSATPELASLRSMYNQTILSTTAVVHTALLIVPARCLATYHRTPGKQFVTRSSQLLWAEDKAISPLSASCTPPVVLYFTGWIRPTGSRSVHERNLSRLRHSRRTGFPGRQVAGVHHVVCSQLSTLSWGAATRVLCHPKIS
ncbi:hypothetical protein BD413DRAFT_538266 [Trametes elegans]|nr:hypothetical protein BD413DRAFT_538266 [Trametes elegans]